jgi:UDP-glucose 4-epimerase
MNIKGITKYSKILIVGGTGSYGNALVDYLQETGARLVIYSRDESKQHDMFVARRNQNIEYIVGDIRDKDKIFKSMKGIDYVFLAAALKHVPTGENFPEEVIKTNILGTMNVIDAAEYCGVKKLVALSTDKAAFPISGYGASKLILEKIVMAHKGDTINVCLRYGNVLGSRGSVVPLFLGYVKDGRPLTITNSLMTRFVLSLEEAVRLSIKCLTDGNNGDLFIMRPPACTVGTIAEALELNCGRKLPKVVIGIRGGEKMHETLLTGEEVYRSIEEKEDGINYARIPIKRTADYFFKGEDYVEPPPYSSENSPQLNAEQVLNKLKEAKLL